MRIDTIHVYVEYRFQTTHGQIPSDKLLRARVRMPDAEGWSYGKELVAPRRITEVWKAEQVCVEKLCTMCRVIVFDYDPRLGIMCPSVRRVAA